MQGIPEPPNALKRLLFLPYAYDVAVAFTVSFGGIAGVIRALNGPAWLVALFIGLGALGMVVFSSVKAFVQFASHERDQSTHELEGCLEGILALLEAKYDSNNDACLRLTVHKPMPDKDRFIQAVEYVGDERGGKCVGRTFPSNAGILGVCQKENQVVYASRKNHVHKDYVRELEKNWNYTKADARRRNQMTMAWYAIPLKAPNGEVLGVVYLDATVAGFFDDESLRADVEATCGGIARFVARRYG